MVSDFRSFVLKAERINVGMGDLALIEYTFCMRPIGSSMERMDELGSPGVLVWVFVCALSGTERVVAMRDHCRGMRTRQTNNRPVRTGD